MGRTTNYREKKREKKIVVTIVVIVIMLIIVASSYIISCLSKGQEEEEFDKASFFLGVSVGYVDMSVLAAYSEGGVSKEEVQKETEILDKFLENPSLETYKELVEYVNSLPYFNATGIYEAILEDPKSVTGETDLASCRAGYHVMFYLIRCTQEYKRGNISEEELQMVYAMNKECTLNPTSEKVVAYLNYTQELMKESPKSQ